MTNDHSLSPLSSFLYYAVSNQNFKINYSILPKPNQDLLAPTCVISYQACAMHVFLRSHCFWMPIWIRISPILLSSQSPSVICKILCATYSDVCESVLSLIVPMVIQDLFECDRDQMSINQACSLRVYHCSRMKLGIAECAGFEIRGRENCLEITPIIRCTNVTRQNSRLSSFRHCVASLPTYLKCSRRGQCRICYQSLESRYIFCLQLYCCLWRGD